MFNVVVSLFVWQAICVVSEIEFSSEYEEEFVIRSKTVPKELYLKESNFAALENYQYNATPTSESKYGWIARVVHSRTQDFPHMCTAVCIDDAIFITAARCLYNLKLNFTSIIYRSKRLHPVVFILPSKMTKQGFDDIGFIVVDRKDYKEKWEKVKFYKLGNRTDNTFQWVSKLNLKKGLLPSTVIGYACPKNLYRIRSARRKYSLTKLDVYVSMDICPKILTDKQGVKGFEVPCYFGCTHDEFAKKSDNCNKYHGVEGGAVLEIKSKKLIGIAIWGSNFRDYELPVGFSFVNSANFFKDYTCATRIKNDKNKNIIAGYYQQLCDME